MRNLITAFLLLWLLPSVLVLRKFHFQVRGYRVAGSYLCRQLVDCCLLFVFLELNAPRKSLTYETQKEQNDIGSGIFQPAAVSDLPVPGGVPVADATWELLCQSADRAGVAFR